jgi:hypothetical protein
MENYSMTTPLEILIRVAVKQYKNMQIEKKLGSGKYLSQSLPKIVKNFIHDLETAE